MSSGLRVLAARPWLLIRSLRGCAAMAPIARGRVVTGSRWAKLAGVAALAATALGCGGGGSSTGSTGAPGTPPAPSYSFAADSGVRVPGGVGPVELVVGATTYLYLGGFIGPMPVKVLASADGLAFTPVPATLDGAALVGGWFSFVSLPSGGFRMYYGFGPNS